MTCERYVRSHRFCATVGLILRKGDVDRCAPFVDRIVADWSRDTGVRASEARREVSKVLVTLVRD